MKYQDLISIPDEQLIELHDAADKNTGYGTQAYLDELVRRRQDKATDALNRMTRALVWLTIAVAVMTAIGTAFGIYAALR